MHRDRHNLLSRGSWLALLVTALPFGSALADDPGPGRFQSARLDAGPLPLTRLLRVPAAAARAQVSIRCVALVSSNGLMARTRCESPDKAHRRAAVAIRSAAKRARPAVATIDENPVAVWVEFRVEFDAADGQRTARLYHHHDPEDRAADFIAPQRALTGYASECETIAITPIELTVSRTGVPLTVSMDTALPPECRNDIPGILAGSIYLPAQSDGQPVEATVRTRLYRAQSSNNASVILYDEFDPNLRAPVEEFE
ncbi:MAG: hypothetical protein AAFU65_03130 [Pseudomonadota bacterium]